MTTTLTGRPMGNGPVGGGKHGSLEEENGMALFFFYLPPLEKPNTFQAGAGV